MTTRTVTFNIIAPARAKRWRQFESDGTARAAEVLGRPLLRWGVYRYVDYGHGGQGWESVSAHWTRRAAWRESSRLRFAEHEGSTP